MNHNINLPLALFQANQDLCYQTMELTSVAHIRHSTLR